MLLRVTLLVLSAGLLGRQPAPPVTRYKIDQRVESRIDLSAFGQGEQVQNVAMVWYLTVSYADTAGGTAMHAVLDSAQMDLGMASPPQSTIDSARGATFDGVLDATGRVIRAGKKGSVPPGLAPILERLAIDPGRWPAAVGGYDRLFRRVLGQAERVRAAAGASGRRWFQGIAACRLVFGPVRK